MKDYGQSKYCKICKGEIVEKGECITMTAKTKICRCKRNNKKVYK